MSDTVRRRFSAPLAALVVRVRPTVRFIAPACIICVPSIWAILRMPPLWRDVDAYVQLVYPPSANTILLHGPLYCSLAKIPLWVGYLISTRDTMSVEHFVWHTQLTDLGVRLLVASQHVGFCAAAMYFVHSVGVSMLARIIAAALLSVQPLFYVFAQCVGSETLGVILVTLLAAELCRMARGWPVVPARRYLAIGTILCCCVLTRQVNRLLIPAPLIAGVLLSLFNLRRSDSLHRRIRACVMLLLVGIVALLWATAMANLLCWRANIPWRSKFGYTFLWRLNFLGEMPAAARKQLLLTTAKSPEARVVATSVDAWFETGNDWDAADLAPVVIRAVVAANPNASESDIDRALNQFACFSLFPPSQALRHAAVSDFWAASRRSSADITQNLFLTTAYAYDHLSWMKQAATLEQFKVPRTDLSQLSRTTYFRIWEWLSYRGCCFAAAIIALLIFLMNRGSSGIFASQLSLAAIGVAILFVTCFFVQLQDRFIVTAMQTIWLTVIAGVVALVTRHHPSENI